MIRLEVLAGVLAIAYTIEAICWLELIKTDIARFVLKSGRVLC